MYFTFMKNNKQTKKPVNRFLQDDASACIRSLQTSIEIKLCQSPWNGSSESDLSLCVFVVKNYYLGFFSYFVYIVTVDTSFYSKMVRKVQLVYVDLLLY